MVVRLIKLRLIYIKVPEFLIQNLIEIKKTIKKEVHLKQAELKKSKTLLNL
jgi:hypothetical protein